MKGKQLSIVNVNLWTKCCHAMLCMISLQKRQTYKSQTQTWTTYKVWSMDFEASSRRTDHPPDWRQQDLLVPVPKNSCYKIYTKYFPKGLRPRWTTWKILWRISGGKRGGLLLSASIIILFSKFCHISLEVFCLGGALRHLEYATKENLIAFALLRKYIFSIHAWLQFWQIVISKSFAYWRPDRRS